MTSPPRDVSVQLATWRASHGWTQEEGARRLGVPLKALQAWERGVPCHRAAMVETAIGLPVARVFQRGERKLFQPATSVPLVPRK